MVHVRSLRHHHQPVNPEKLLEQMRADASNEAKYSLSEGVDQGVEVDDWHKVAGLTRGYAPIR